LEQKIRHNTVIYGIYIYIILIYWKPEVEMETQSLLQEISSKLEIIQMTLTEMLDISRSANSNVLDNLSEIVSSISNLSTVFSNEIADCEINFQPDIRSVVKTANGIKKSLIKIWKKSLNERKQAFWNSMKFTKISAIYENWLKQSTPVLPRKLRPINIPGEHEEDRAIRKENAIQNMKSEIKIINNKAERLSTLFKKIDSEMGEIFANGSEDDVLQKLQEMWQEACIREEEKSVQIWRKKEMWYNDYSKKYGSDIFVNLESNKDERISSNATEHRETRRLYSTVVKSPPTVTGRPKQRLMSDGYHGNAYREPQSRYKGVRKSYTHYNHLTRPHKQTTSRTGSGHRSQNVNSEMAVDDDIRFNPRNRLQYITRASFLGQSCFARKGGGNNTEKPVCRDSQETLVKQVV